MSVLTITSKNFESEVLQSDKSVLVDFFATWCGPCKMMSPIVDAIAEEREDIKVCKINVDEETELAVKYRIASIPTLLVIKNGEVTGQAVGVRSKEQILELF